MIFNNTNVNNWVNKTDDKNQQLYQNTQQNYNEIAAKKIQTSNADLVSQMVNNNEIKDLLILEKITVQKEYESKQLAEKFQHDLDVYLCDGNKLLEQTEIDDDVILCLSLKQRRSKPIEELNRKSKHTTKIKKKSKIIFTE